MFDQECHQIVQELIDVTKARVKAGGAENAYPVVVRLLVEYGGWNADKAEHMANQLIRIASMQEAATQ